MGKNKIIIKDEKVNKYIKILLNNGGKAFIVGGYVRDYLLGNISKDLDIEVYNLDFDTLKEILGNQAQEQTNFGILILKDTKVEFAIPRYENKIGIKHQDFNINLNPFMKPIDAAYRRDFTINALMYDIEEEKILDFYNGIEDLKNKTIRHVSNKFIEDPLRVLRAIRFSSILGFEINADTLNLCVSMLDDLSYISSARKNQEMTKFISSNIDNFKVGFKYFEKLILMYYKISFVPSSSNTVKNSLFLCNINKEKYKKNYKVLFWSILLININEKNKIDYILNDMLINKKEIKLIKLLIDDYAKMRFDSANDIFKSFKVYKEDITLLIELHILQINLSNKLYDNEKLVLHYKNNVKQFNKVEEVYKKLEFKSQKLNGHYYMQKGYIGKEIKDAQRKDLTKYIKEII